MALSFNVQPTSIKGALSSMIYQAYDTDYANAGFYYEFSVYVWNGTTSLPATPKYVIQRFPDVYGSYRAWIDVSKLVTQYIDDISLVVGTALPTILGSAVYVAVKAQGKWTSGSGTAVTSNVILATKGYEYTLDGFNQSATTWVLSDRTTVWMTTETQYDYLWYDASKVTSISLNGSIPVSVSVSTNSNSYIKGIELKQLLTANSLWGVDTTLAFTSSTGTKTVSIKFDCVNKYGCVTMLFKNRYGVYEGLSMNGVSKVNVQTSKEQYQKAVYDSATLNTQWSYGVSTKNLYNIQGVSRQVVNTNWIDESYVDYVQQILLSSQCFVYFDGKLIGCQIIDSAMEKKRKTNDKLISYTLVVEYAQPLINSIVR